MPRYVIEREIPGAGKLTGDQLQGISQRCCGVLWKLGPEIQWIDIMGNWIPDDPTLVAQILRISSSYSPPPPEGFISPMTWGIENNVIERFAGAGGSQREDILRQGHVYVQFSKRTIRARGCIQKMLRTNHECFRRCREERSSS
jgi:hypothetical protein